MSNNNHIPAPIRMETGPEESAYQESAKRLATIASRLMGDVRQLRSAGSDVFLMRAELSALAEILIEAKLTTNQQLFRRLTDCMDKMSNRLERKVGSSIFLPGRN